MDRHDYLTGNDSCYVVELCYWIVILVIISYPHYCILNCSFVNQPHDIVSTLFICRQTEIIKCGTLVILQALKFSREDIEKNFLG